MELVLLAAMAFLVFALLGRTGSTRHQAAIAGGQRVRQQLDALYAGEHEYARVVPPAFPDADLAFYDASSAELEKQGFRRLADIEDLTLSRVYPDQRTFIRVLVDQGGVIRAGIYHVRPRGGLVWLFQLLGQVPRHVRAVELVSEVPTGKFLSTSNTKGIDRLEPAPDIRVERLDRTATVAELVARHRARLQAHVRAHPDQVPAHLITYDEMLASVQRGNLVVARWRQKVGRLTRDELERMQGRPLNDVEELFLREVQATPVSRGAERRDEPKPAEAKPAAAAAADDELVN